MCLQFKISGRPIAFQYPDKPFPVDFPVLIPDQEITQRCEDYRQVGTTMRAIGSGGDIHEHVQPVNLMDSRKRSESGDFSLALADLHVVLRDLLADLPVGLLPRKLVTAEDLERRRIVTAPI